MATIKGKQIARKSISIDNLDDAAIAQLQHSATYIHNQLVSSATWIITHGLGKYPSVITISPAGTVVQGDVFYSSNNQLTVTFSAAFSGSAYLN